MAMTQKRIKSVHGIWWKIGQLVKDGLGHPGMIVGFETRAYARVEWDFNHMTTGAWLSELRKVEEAA